MTTMLDRVVRWNLDLGGDLYGDERERYRWYEGIATAATLQWLLVPWAAAIMIWPLGKPAILPLSVVLAALLLPRLVGRAYVRSRQVDPMSGSWKPKRVVLTILGGLPFGVFAAGALYVHDPAGAPWGVRLAGAVLGAAIGVLGSVFEARSRRRREAVAGDED